MHKAVIDRLEQFANDGDGVDNPRAGKQWATQVAAFINAALGDSHAVEFIKQPTSNDWDAHVMRLGHLKGIIARAYATGQEQPNAADQNEKTNPFTPNPGALDSRKIFLVHGHDNEIKETAARYLERLSLEPIILHEQPNSGRTIIEKFEIYSGDISYAVVLLTPDDLGCAKDDTQDLKPRARQNVILELGYFMGRLGRHRVCALYKGGVQLPTDIQGVVYVELDSAGAWKTKLAQEFVQAKLPMDLSGVLGG